MCSPQNLKSRASLEPIESQRSYNLHQYDVETLTLQLTGLYSDVRDISQQFNLGNEQILYFSMRKKEDMSFEAYRIHQVL